MSTTVRDLIERLHEEHPDDLVRVVAPASKDTVSGIPVVKTTTEKGGGTVVEIKPKEM